MDLKESKHQYTTFAEYLIHFADAGSCPSDDRKFKTIYIYKCECVNIFFVYSIYFFLCDNRLLENENSQSILLHTFAPCKNRKHNIILYMPR